VSGKKQHYIPQVLLRGFSLTDAKFPPIVVYSRNRGVYKTNTRDAAAESEFYSPYEHEGISLDDEITTYEGKLSAQLDTIKTAGDNAIDPEVAASVVVHLALRNDHTRKMFGSAGEGIVSALGEVFREAKNARAMMGFDKPFNESMAKQEIRKLSLKSAPAISMVQRASLEKQLLQKMEREFDEFYNGQMETIQGAIERLLHSVDGMATEAHRKALSNSIVPPELRVQVLAKLNWRLVSGSFILPDCVAISVLGNEASPYMLTDEEGMKNVLMPISHDLGMHGTSCDATLPSSERLNELFAACSSEFFIAPRVDDGLRPLVEIVGTRTAERVADLTNDAAAQSKFGDVKNE